VVKLPVAPAVAKLPPNTKVAGLTPSAGPNTVEFNMVAALVKDKGPVVEPLQLVALLLTTIACSSVLLAVVVIPGIVIVPVLLALAPKLPTTSIAAFL
jgi:hypothetical protein